MCYSVMKFSNIPLDYYYCSVAVSYWYFDDNDDFRNSPDTKETCTYNESKIIVFNYVYYLKYRINVIIIQLSRTHKHIHTYKHIHNK